MGQAPTHPKLLDYLAANFRKDGWSTKSLIRTLVLSRSYRLSSNSESAVGVARTLDPVERDPDARLRWRMTPRRLEAEAIRDSILLASRQLVEGSPGPSDAARKGFHQVGEVKVSYDIPHRSIYLSILRKKLPRELELFDFPDPAFVRGTRAMANTPTQALYMMNSEFVSKASRLTAQHVLSGNRDTLADVAVRAILGRPSRPDEVRQIASYIDKTTKAGANVEEAWSRLCQILFASTEFRYVW